MYDSRLAVIAAVIALLASASESHSEDALKPDIVFLLIGQSNMAGRAPLEEDDKTEFKNVLLLNADNKWEPARNPLNRYASNRKTISMQRLGPGDGFVRHLRQQIPDATIGLIVNARGGTSIEQWEKGKPLYDNTLKRLKAAGMPKIAAVLWHQGEANGADPDYGDKLARFIATLRKDLSSPAMPFIAGQVAKDLPVNDHIAALPEKVKHTAFASSKELTVFDGVHFDRKSQKTLGARYAEAYLRLVKIDKK